MIPTLDDIKDMLECPTVSFWLKDAIGALWQRDPVDALNDVELLKHLCDLRWKEISNA